MHPLFARLLQQHTPEVNPHVMEGLGAFYIKRAEEYIDKVFRSASKSFPAGLEYLGYERCSVEEEYAESTRVKNNKRTFDLAKTDLYLVKYKFKFNGEPIPDRYIYLPYTNDAGIFSLGGAQFHITPVLSNKVISPGFDSVFVRVLRDKIIFKRCYHSLVIDGIRETTHVIVSNLYRKGKPENSVTTTKALTCIVHYLLGKYGFTGMFERYTGFVPKYGTNDINPRDYPPEDWVICQSFYEDSQIKPKTYIGEQYKPTNIRLAIPRSHWNSAMKAFVSGFYYVVDHFPFMIKGEPEYLDRVFLDEHNQIDDRRSFTTWKLLMGHILFSGQYAPGVLIDNIAEHYQSLNHYVDDIVKENLRESGYNISDFYDLCAMIVSNFNNIILENQNSVLSMYGKSLEVLYYALYDITEGIFKVNYALTKLASKKPLNKNNVIETFNKNVRIGAIFKLSSGKIIAESVSYSGDHKYPKITSKITEQESIPGSNRGKSHRKVVGEDKHIDISMIEAGSLLFLSKSNPTPTQRVNPFICLDLATGIVLPNPKFDEIRERTRKLFIGTPDQNEQLERIHFEDEEVD